MTVRRNRLPRAALVWSLSVALGAAPGFAGKLDEFETDATENRGGGDDDHDHGSSYDEYGEHDGDGAAAVVAVLLLLPVYGGMRSWARVTGATEVLDEKIDPRPAGVATIPFIRVDPAYQLVESDVDAWDIRGELGFGPFAVQARETHYDEDEPSDDLDLVQAHALLRMEFMDELEVDLGLGGLVISGNETASGISGTAPVLIHPWEFLGLEFRPAWAGVNDNVVQDYDLSLLAGWRFVSVRAGYRWTKSGGESLNGPIFGAAARW